VKLLRRNPLFVLYGMLLVHWVVFINYGTADFRSFDWYVIHQWLDVIKLALVTHQIPYEVTLWSEVGPFSDLFGNKYFAMPFLILSPQILLLRWMSIQAFITIQIVLAMTAGLYALVLWKKHLALSDFSASVLILIWSLNGALVARMGVGHVQLTGYFLVPAFLYCLKLFLDALAEPKSQWHSARSALIMSCFLLVVLLQGSVHTVYQMSLILGLFSLVFLRSFKYVMLTFGVFSLLAAYFIIPNLIYGTYSVAAEGAESRIIFGGYGTGFDATLRAITGIALPDVSLSALSFRNVLVLVPIALFETVSHLVLALVYPFSARFDGSWEYSVYVGPVGFSLMLAGWYGFFKGDQADGRRFLGEHWRHMLLTVIIFGLSLSVTSGLLWLALQEVFGLNAIDRLPTRLFLYPLLVSLLCMSVGLDRLIDRVVFLNQLWIKGVILIGLTLTLLLNSFTWFFHKVSIISLVAEASARQDKPFFSTSIIEVSEPAYRLAVNTGFVLSFLGLLGVITLMALMRKWDRVKS